MWGMGPTGIIVPAPARRGSALPKTPCWADTYLPNGEPVGESCNKEAKDCRIGLCPECCKALCGGAK